MPGATRTVYFLGAESFWSRTPLPTCVTPRGHSAHAAKPNTITSDSRRSKVAAVYNDRTTHRPITVRSIARRH